MAVVPSTWLVEVGGAEFGHQVKRTLLGLVKGSAQVFADHAQRLAALELDTAIAAYLIDPAETQYALGELLVKYTGDTLPARHRLTARGQALRPDLHDPPSRQDPL